MNKAIKELLCSSNCEDVTLGLEIAKRRRYKASTLSKLYWSAEITESNIFLIFNNVIEQFGGPENYKNARWKNDK